MKESARLPAIALAIVGMAVGIGIMMIGFAVSTSDHETDGYLLFILGLLIAIGLAAWLIEKSRRKET